MDLINPIKKKLKIIKYQGVYEEDLVNLWEKCGLIVPQNNPQVDIRNKLDFQPNLIYRILWE